MLLYVEDRKREREPQDFDQFKSAVVQAAANTAYLAAEKFEEQGQTVCVGALRNFSARGLAHPILHILSSYKAALQQWRDFLSLAYYCRTDAVNGMKNLDYRSTTDDVTRNAFKEV